MQCYILGFLNAKIMKTPINELIEWLEFKTQESMDLDLMQVAVVYNLVKMKCKGELLSLEKEQIKEHFEKGFLRSKTALLSNGKHYSKIYIDNLNYIPKI